MLFFMVGVAQLVEPWIVIPVVVGSSPIVHPNGWNMKFFKSKADINQSLSIVVPNKEIEEQVLTKLKTVQKDSKLKGFRKGKAPMDVVTSIYGPEIRQEVIWDLASKSFSKLAQEPVVKSASFVPIAIAVSVSLLKLFAAFPPNPPITPK